MSAAPTPASVEAPVKPKRLIYFDFTRGLAAQLVVVGHLLNICWPEYFFQPKTGHPFHIQSLAVVIFFVLSGFLITATVLKKRHDPRFTFGSYLIDRAARVLFPLIPALVLIISFDFLVFRSSWSAVFFRDINLSPTTIVHAFLLTFNHPGLEIAAEQTGTSWLFAKTVGTGAPLWTVAIEWWIYVAFGLLALVLARSGRLGFPGTVLLLFAAAVPIGVLVHNSALPLAWAIGMLYALGAERLQQLPARFHAWTAALALIAFAGGCYYSHNKLESAVTVIPASVAFFSIYLIMRTRRRFQRPQPERSNQPGSSIHEQSRTRFDRVCIFVSDFSYSLYLIHFSIITYIWFIWHDSLPAWALFSAGFVASNIAAIIFWKIVESRHHLVGRALKRKLLPRSL